MANWTHLDPARQLFPPMGAPLAGLALGWLSLFAAGCANHVTVSQIPVPRVDPVAEMASARGHYQRIAAGQGTAADIRAYNESVKRLIQRADLDDGELTIGDRPVPLDDRLEGLTRAEYAEKIKPADAMLIRGFRERVVVDGVGAPVVLQYPAEGYSSHKGRFQPATAILDFPGPDGEPRIILHDTLAQAEASVNGSPPQPLRADFTAPLASRFAAEDLQRINIPALLLFDRYASDLGMTRIDDTYPDKIPVVFVHGLKSSTITWRNVMNELRSDPLVRDRYEFWTFGYGTGAPIPFSAMKLREALQGMATYREHLGAKTTDVVLVGHSMGGLLSRLMTERSGDEVWYEYFKQPVEELPLSERDREILRRMAYFEPLPFVRRVTFIATPHGGSQIADNLIGQVSSSLIRLPVQLLNLSGSVIRAPFSLLTPAGERVVTRMPTSISQLASQSELLQRLKSMPLNPQVTFHSIIGDRGLGDALGESSDGVVPYSSAHLEGTRSETIVAAGHNAHLHPAAIAELSRILREHAATR
jgi:pimeloyl-ACP methyl ester carboxylesterase